jgi:hypothetical protein
VKENFRVYALKSRPAPSKIEREKNMSRLAPEKGKKIFTRWVAMGNEALGGSLHLPRPSFAYPCPKFLEL